MIFIYDIKIIAFEYLQREEKEGYSLLQYNNSTSIQSSKKLVQLHTNYMLIVYSPFCVSSADLGITVTL